MLRKFLRGAAVVGVCTLGAACATVPEDELGSPFDRSSRDEAVRLTIQNHDFLDANIYAYWNGMRERVGTVTGKTTSTFTLDWRSEFIRLEVEFIGSDDDYVSEMISVTQGDHLDFVILPSTGRPSR